MNLKSTTSHLLKSTIFRESASYTILNFLEKALPFIVFPILTRNLSIEDLGLFVLYLTIVEILMPIMTLNIDNTMLINFYKMELTNFKKYFSSGLILFGCIFSFALLIITVFQNTISEFIHFPATWIIVVGLIVFFRFLVQNRQNLWRVNFEILKYSKLTLGISITNNLLGVVLVLYSDIGWKGMIVGHLIGYSVFGLYALITFLNEQLFVWKKDYIFIKDIFIVSLPIAIHRIGIWLGSTANKMIIAAMIGVAATGSYGVGAIFASIIAILEDALSKAIIPHIYEKLKKKSNNDNKEIVKMSYNIYIFLTVISVIVYLIGYNLIDFIFGTQLEETKSLIFPLILAALFKGFYKLHVHYIFFTKKTIKVTQITLMTGLLNIGLSYFLILN